MSFFKTIICFICLIIIWSIYESFHERDADTPALKNKYFSLIQNQNSKEAYYVYFRDSISAIDTILSIKQAITFCTAKEKDNPFFIYYRTTNTENLNHLFLKKHNQNKQHMAPTAIDELNLEISSSYNIFLRKHLFDNGCILDDSVFITTPDMQCGLDNTEKLCLYGGVCIYFNWQNITNITTSE